MSNVNHPKHYTECSIECIEAMLIAYGKKEVYSFCKLNAFKYLWRYKHKNGVEDLDKALFYVNKAEELYPLDVIEYADSALYMLKTTVEEHKKKYIDEMALKRGSNG